MSLISEYKNAVYVLNRDNVSWYNQMEWANEEKCFLTNPGSFPYNDTDLYPRKYENLRILNSDGSEAMLTALRSEPTKLTSHTDPIYDINVMGAGCKMYDYQQWMPRKASITQNSQIKELYSNKTFDPMDDRNVYAVLPTEVEVMKEYVFDSIFNPGGPRFTYLNLTPTVYGDIVLTKGAQAPVAKFEYSYDGTNWSVLDPLILEGHPGETVYFRGHEPQNLSLSPDVNHSYVFVLPAYTIVGGYVDSMMELTPSTSAFDTRVGNFRVRSAACLFKGNTTLTGTVGVRSYTLSNYALSSIFDGCQNLRRVILQSTRIPNINLSLSNWLDNTSGNAGVLYCSANLQLPTGAGGLPDGWVRINI